MGDYRSDHRGFNNADEVWESSRLILAALGDSFTHGYCVSRDTEFRRSDPTTRCRRLESGDRRQRPAAATRDAHGAPSAARSADRVVVLLQGNDLLNLQDERRSPLLRRYLTDGFVQLTLPDRATSIVRSWTKSPGSSAGNRRTARKNAEIAIMTVPLLEADFDRERLAPLANSDPYARETAADFAAENMEVFARSQPGERANRGMERPALFRLSPGWARSRAIGPGEWTNALKCCRSSAIWGFRSSTSIPSSRPTVIRSLCSHFARSATIRNRPSAGRRGGLPPPLIEVDQGTSSLSVDDVVQEGIDTATRLT